MQSSGTAMKELHVLVDRLNITEVVDKTGNTGVSTRRSARNKSKPKKYGEFLETSPTKRKRAVTYSSSDENSDYFDNTTCLQKPTALFSEDDVEGQDMFKFKSRHTKNDLQNIVKSSTNYSPKFQSPLKTPRKSLLKVTEATPTHITDIMKKRIIKEVQSDSGDSDFSGTSSDFVPEESEDESDTSQSNNSEEVEDPTPKKSQGKVQIKRNTDAKARDKHSEYVVTPDNYFMMHSSKKVVTSNNTLDSLRNFNLNNNLELPEDIHFSEEHKNRIADLNKSYEHLFNRWLFVLSENFNIVLYGVGSKRNVLHSFQQKKLGDMPCIVVNGYFPSLTIKSILDAIIVDLLECNRVPTNISDVVSLIDEKLEEEDKDLYLIIHNIDGVNLRNSKAQAMLASISQIKRVHTLASIDHINASLLWDHTKLSKFKFTWWDVTTFMPYVEETSFENSLLSHRSGALQLSSLKGVYQSLTTNARGIFNIIIQYQLENHKQQHYQGLPLRELYSKSREQFLVSSDVALRAQLTEFIDHKLVKIKRTCDGSENLIIPIDNSLLQHFLEQQA